MKEKTKNVWTFVLTLAKYAVAIALGYITGDGSVIHDLI